jgi:cysteine desulfurase/selenocysteine lyase
MITDSFMQGWPPQNLENELSGALNRMYWEEDLKPLNFGSYLPPPGAEHMEQDARELYYFLSRPTGKARPSGIPGLRDDFPILRRRVNGCPLVWLDNAATTQKPNCVIDAVCRYYRETNSNVHRGAHQLSREATEAYEEAREKLRLFLGASSREEIVFVRGATEAINLVSASWGGTNLREGDEILLTEMEHHSNIVPWQIIAQRTGAVIKAAPVNDRGEINLSEYGRMFTPRTRIAAATHVSNVLGTVNPVRAMADIAHMHGALFLVDGAQSAPHMPIDVKQLDADFFVLSGHKMYGPTGIGVLYGKKGLLSAMPPYQGGGGMIRNVRFERTHYMGSPDKFEAGTSNIAGAVGLGAAADYLRSAGMERIRLHELELTNYLTNSLSRIPGLTLIGTAADKISVVSFVLQSMDAAMIAEQLDKRGVAIRAGKHCAQPVLERFGVNSAARASIGLYNTFEELDLLTDTVRQLSGY